MSVRSTGKTKPAGSETNIAGSRNLLSLSLSASQTLSKTGIEATFLATLLSFAARGLLPQCLKSSQSAALVDRLARKLFGIEDLKLDRSPFADCLLKGCDLKPLSDLNAIQTEVETLFTNPDFPAAVADPLFTGWVHQASVMSRENYAELRSEKSLSGLSQITQWFTPAWISEFLVNECVADQCDRSSLRTFLDSSCGAGHILVPALQQLVQERVEKFDEPVSLAVENAISTQIFGIDIDPLMVSLSALSLYLACRDLTPDAPLPVPQLLGFTPIHRGQSKELPSPSCHGSLLLGLSEPDESIHLYRLDGSQITISELPRQFDMQALNPPYLSHRLMPKASGKFLQEHYEGCHYDLYAAFLELGIRLMTPTGTLALICQQSFLTTTRYENFRRTLVSRCGIASVVQLGAGSFASRGGEKVSNAIVTLKGPAHHERCAEELDVYKLTSRTSKQIAEQEGIASYSKNTVSSKSLLAKTHSIPGFPLAPSCPDEIARLFQTHPTIGESDLGITLTNGLFTCDNKRFVRHFSEVETNSPSGFVPYDKGGGHKWFSTTPFLLEWKDEGNEIREFRKERGQSRALPGERFYFQPGITYSYIGTKGFKARLLSPGSVFDIASSAIFTSTIDLFYILGFLNSSLTRYILGMLNPTVNFQIGDLRRLPMLAPDDEVQFFLANLSREAVELAREADKLNRSSPAYIGPLLTAFASSQAETQELAYQRLCAHAQAINLREAQIQKSIDEAIFDLYLVSGTTRDIICENEWVASTEEPLITVPTLSKCRSEIAKRRP